MVRLSILYVLVVVAVRMDVLDAVNGIVRMVDFVLYVMRDAENIQIHFVVHGVEFVHVFVVILVDVMVLFVVVMIIAHGADAVADKSIWPTLEICDFFVCFLMK